jgi:hypothetical protein
MATTHVPRLAWDGARLLVQSAQSEATFRWMADRVFPILPRELFDSYLETRNRLVWRRRDDVESVEAGVWRVRLEDLLIRDPERALPLGTLIDEVRDALSGYSGRKRTRLGPPPTGAGTPANFPP